MFTGWVANFFVIKDLEDTARDLQGLVEITGRGAERFGLGISCLVSEAKVEVPSLVPTAPSRPLSHSLGGAPARGPGGETRPSGPALPEPAPALDKVLGQQGARPKRLLPTWCRQMTNMSAHLKKDQFGL